MTPHGGKRPGSGRPAKDGGRMVVLTFAVPPQALADFKAEAAQAGVSISQLVRVKLGLAHLDLPSPK